MAIGTWDWAAGGGRLSLAERWSLTLAALRARTHLRKQNKAAEPAAGRSILEQLEMKALDSIAPPQGTLAVAAVQAATAAQPEWLTQHALRTYAWGALLALNADLRHDRELLFAASLMHDLGLVPKHAHPRSDCFAARGARAAHEIMLDAGAQPARARCVADAISLHLNLQVDVAQGAEAHMVQAGAGLDVIGRRYREIPATLRQAVLARHPRLGLTRHICQCLQSEARASPNSRIGLYVRRLGFLGLVERAPFAE
jgi:hypothetical protein